MVKGLDSKAGSLSSVLRATLYPPRAVAFTLIHTHVHTHKYMQQNFNKPTFKKKSAYFGVSNKSLWEPRFWEKGNPSTCGH